MRKFIIFSIMVFSVSVVAVGSSIAYYNTKSFGFDEDAVLFAMDDESVTYLDMKIYFEDIKNARKTAEKYLPKEACTMRLYAE